MSGNFLKTNTLQYNVITATFLKVVSTTSSLWLHNFIYSSQYVLHKTRQCHMPISTLTHHSFFFSVCLQLQNCLYNKFSSLRHEIITPQTHHKLINNKYVIQNNWHGYTAVPWILPKSPVRELSKIMSHGCSKLNSALHSQHKMSRPRWYYFPFLPQT